MEAATDSPTGITAITSPHGDHIVIAYIDASGRLRSLETAEIPSSLPVLNMITEVPIPASRTPDPRTLQKDEWRFLALCDGKRNLKEIAELLGIPYTKIRLMAETLKSRGFLRDIEIVVK